MHRPLPACLIDTQHRLPLAAHWGSGTTSSSDAQFFRAGGRGEVGGLVNLHYGQDPGVKFYTHLSDQFGPYHTKVIAATAHEAPHVLDGLLYHQSSLVINEHYTDTGGFSDHVFAMCHLLGFRFAPRIRDLKEKRLYLLPGMTVPPELASLVAGAISVRVITDHWFELLRLAMSIKTGTVTASLILRKLAAYPGRTVWPSHCENWESWNGLSLHSNGCRTPSCVVVATSRAAETRGVSKAERMSKLSVIAGRPNQHQHQHQNRSIKKNTQTALRLKRCAGHRRIQDPKCSTLPLIQIGKEAQYAGSPLQAHCSMRKC